MDSELWVYLQKQMHMVWHDFHFDDFKLVFVSFTSKIYVYFSLENTLLTPYGLSNVCCLFLIFNSCAPAYFPISHYDKSVIRHTTSLTNTYRLS